MAWAAAHSGCSVGLSGVFAGGKSQALTGPVTGDVLTHVGPDLSSLRPAGAPVTPEP